MPLPAPDTASAALNKLPSERSIRLGTLTSLAAAGVYPNVALKSRRWIRGAVWLAGLILGMWVPGEPVRERDGASRCRWP